MAMTRLERAIADLGDNHSKNIFELIKDEIDSKKEVNDQQQVTINRQQATITQLEQDVLHLREKIAAGLVSYTDKRGVGRPSTSSRPATPTTPPPAPTHFARHPVEDVRYDGLHHDVIMLPNTQKRDCKLCKKSKTQFFCEKCKLHLCITKEKNCYKAYHYRK